jgi:hypothetical protein
MPSTVPDDAPCIEREQEARHHFTTCELGAAELDDVLVGRNPDVVANANCRNQNSELLRRLLAQHRDALEQIAALLFVDERNERVADLELDRIDLQQVGHRIRGRRRGSAGMIRGGLRLNARLLSRRSHASERDETTAEARGRNLRKSGHEPKAREHQAPAIVIARGCALSWRREHYAHAIPAAAVRHHDAGGRADDQRRNLRDESVADGEDRVLRQRLADRQSALERADEDAADDVDRR